MNHSINIPITLTSEQCHSVLHTGLAGGIGYWDLDMRNSKYFEGDLISFEIECTDTPAVPLPTLDDADEATKDGEWTEVNEHTVVAGLRRVIAGGVCAGYIRDEILALVNGDGVEYADADQADVILQAGLFGELVYG